MARIEVSGSFFELTDGGSVRFWVAVAACREDGTAVTLEEGGRATLDLRVALSTGQPTAFRQLIIEEWGSAADGFALVRCVPEIDDLNNFAVSSIAIQVTEGSDSGLAIAEARDLGARSRASFLGGQLGWQARWPRHVRRDRGEGPHISSVPMTAA